MRRSAIPVTERLTALWAWRRAGEPARVAPPHQRAGGIDCLPRRGNVISSRRRHTRLQGEWSSDVCSSYLRILVVPGQHVKTGEPMLDVSSPDFSQLLDRKSTRLNSSHLVISYAVFCLK